MQASRLVHTLSDIIYRVTRLGVAGRNAARLDTANRSAPVR